MKVDMPSQVDRDEQLLGALRQREPTAAERLVTAYWERAYRLAVRITENGQDAEEVVQDALWAVVRNIDRFRRECSFGSWLFRIVTNAAYHKRRYRQSRRREVSWDEVLPDFDEQSRHVMRMTDRSARVTDPAVQKELWLALTAAINELPADYRTVLVLRDVDGLSTLEIAQLLGLSIPAVKTRAYRARLFLRQHLNDGTASWTRALHPNTGHGNHGISVAGQAAHDEVSLHQRGRLEDLLPRRGDRHVADAAPTSVGRRGVQAG
jgi:RNA polymerase sigma-70 factor (ECF subfamily)